MEQHSPTNLFNPLTDEQSIFQEDLSQEQSPGTDIFLEPDEEDNEDFALGVTKVIKKAPNNKKKYDNITNDMRLKLIDAVENKGQKIKHAAKILNINYSSAKSICQVFKREGRSNKKAFKRRDFKNEHNIQSKTDNSFPVLNTEVPNPAAQPLKLPEPLPEQPEPQDSLMALRDRLLGSRSESKQSNSQYPLKLDVSSSNSNESAYSMLQSTKASTPLQTDLPKSYFGQQIMLEQSSQPKQNYMLNGLQGQMVYMLPNGVGLNGMAPLVIAGQQQPQSMMPGNFGPIVSQSMTPAGPTQTININQPYAKNMSIQTISLPENSGLDKASPMMYPNNILLNQKAVTAQAPQQIPFYTSGYQGFAINPLTGAQQPIMQAPIYMMQQGNNLIQMNSYPQVIQPGSNYGVAYNPNYTLNYMNVQPVGVYRWNNQMNLAGIDPKIKVIPGMQQQQQGLGILQQGPASEEK